MTSHRWHNLPLDRSRPVKQNFTGNSIILTLPKTLEQQLQNLANAEDVTLFMLLQSAFALLLGRYAGDDEFIIGTAVANRQHANLDPLIGFFVNTLVLRNRFSQNASYIDYLAQSKQLALDAFDHQQLPFDLLVEHLQPQRNFSHSPLCQVMFALQNNQRTDLALDNLKLSELSTANPVAKFDLTLSITPTDHGLEATWEYATALFDQATIERLAQSYQCLLENIINTPEQNIYRLALNHQSTQIQTQTQTQQYNNTAQDFADHLAIHQLFEQWATKAPQQPALYFEGQYLSYQALNLRANRLAGYLLQEHLTPNQRVAVCLPRGIALITALLAILKSGCAYVPLDPDYPTARLNHMIADSGAMLTIDEALLAQFNHRDMTTNNPSAELNPNTFTANSFTANSFTANNLAYVIYTSGSTGKPKGVMLGHQGLVNLSAAQAKHFAIKPDSRVLQFASISFDAATWEWVMALTNGACLYLTDNDTVKSGEQLFKLYCRAANQPLPTLPPALLPFMIQDPMPTPKPSDCRWRKLSTRAGTTMGHRAQFLQCLWPLRNHSLRHDWQI